MLKKVMNLYNTNAKFHSFVVALEYGAVGFLSTWNGGIPSGKQGWIALAAGLAGAVISAGKRWAATNVATENLTLVEKK